MSNHRHLVIALLGALGTGGAGHAVDVRLHLGTTPGFDKNHEEFTSGNGNTTYTLDQAEGLRFGVVLTWVEPVGISLLSGVEVGYRQEGGTNEVGDELETTQVGIGGRLGLGWVITPGLRLEAGGRAVVGYAETDDAQDSYGPAGNVLIVYAIHEDASGVGCQVGAFLGLTYLSSPGILIGVELGYEYTYADLDTGGVTHTVSGAGATAGINVGYSF